MGSGVVGKTAVDDVAGTAESGQPKPARICWGSGSYWRGVTGKMLRFAQHDKGGLFSFYGAFLQGRK